MTSPRTRFHATVARAAARRRWRRPALAAALAGASFAAQAGDRLLATWGVTEAEGAAGGGLTPWALIAGPGSRDQIGATAYATGWRSGGDFSLRTVGAAVGFYDTVELSIADWRFGLSDTVPGQSIGMDVAGLKWRVWGDVVQDQDLPWPQVAIGLQYKHNRDMTVPTALGARHGSDTDVYASATKLWLGGAGGYNLLANLTARATRANQFGLLGFGGDQGDTRRIKAEGSLAVLPRDDLAIGIEWRDKPDNLSVFKEQAASDVFVAWFASPHVSLTGGFVDLGNIANKPRQRGWYLSLQGAF